MNTDSEDRWIDAAIRRGRPGAAVWFGVVGGIAIGAYYLLSSSAQSVLYDVISGAAGAAIVVGIRLRRPARPLPWWLLGVAQLAYVIGDVLYDEIAAHTDNFPTIADWFYLAEYPLMVLALAIFIRRRTSGWQLATMLDAAVVAIGLGLLGWVYIISPLATAPNVTVLARVVSVAYPVMDLLVLTVSMRLVLGGGRRSPTFYLLLVSSSAMLVADVIYAAENQTGTWADGTWVDALWLVEYVLLGAAALHPSMRALDEETTVAPPEATAGRLATLAAASLVAPGVLLVQHLRAAPTHIVLIALSCAVLFLLVLARMAGLVAAQRRVAITDALTGLYTRGFLQETLRVEADRAARSETPLGLLLIDADHFKRINDTYGHPVGDRALQQIAARLRASCRPGDVIARYGGEEFAVLLSGATPDLVESLAERVRAAMADEPLPLGDGFLLRFTISVGAATLGDGVDSADAIVLAADRALYAAKHAGRNRAVTAWCLPDRPAAAPVSRVQYPPARQAVKLSG